MLRSKFPCSLVLPAALLSLSCKAKAGNPSMPPNQVRDGVTYEKVETKSGNVIHFVTVDLTNPSVQLHVSKSSEGYTTPRKFADRTGAFIAINGDFFDVNYDNIPLGLSIGDGAKWPGTQVMPSWFLLACNQSNNCEIKKYAKTSPISSNWRNVIGGRDVIATAGVPWNTSDDNSVPYVCAINAPRTAVGLSKDKGTLIIGVAEGYAEEAGGLRCSAMAEQMVNYGAWDVLNLDGGGSSQLVLDGKLISKRPDNEPMERVVGNIFGVLVTTQK